MPSISGPDIAFLQVPVQELPDLNNDPEAIRHVLPFWRKFRKTIALSTYLDYKEVSLEDLKLLLEKGYLDPEEFSSELLRLSTHQAINEELIAANNRARSTLELHRVDPEVPWDL